MSKVATDLESLIAFREHLIRFNRTLAEEFSSMRAHWQSLGDVWTDVKYHEFGAALEEVERRRAELEACHMQAMIAAQQGGPWIAPATSRRCAMQKNT